MPDTLARIVLPVRPVIADLGCGAGRSSLQLAEQTGGEVICVDTAEPFLSKLAERAAGAGLEDRITTRLADMMDAGIASASLDLIWAEGSVYLVEFEAALSRWKPLLKPTGHIALSDCAWISDDPPQAITEFWGHAYPDMTTIAHRARQARDLGFEVVSSFALGMAAWEEYYAEMREELARRDDLPTEFREGVKQEIRAFEIGRGTYDYAVLILRKADEGAASND